MTNSFQSTAFTSSASPVDTFVAPPGVQQNTGLQELASALKTINPNLNKYFATQMENAAKEESYTHDKTSPFLAFSLK